MLRSLILDARALAGVAKQDTSWAGCARVALAYDSFHVTSLQRLRLAARKRRIPAVNHLLRVVQTGLYGIEIGYDVTLGHGVWFIHPLGIVIGGTSRVGDRVRFFGNNTLGQAKEDGYPTLEEDVWVGAGARILGPVRIGARARVGANAVVLRDVPADHVAVGAPARILAPRSQRPASSSPGAPS